MVVLIERVQQVEINERQLDQIGNYYNLYISYTIIKTGAMSSKKHGLTIEIEELGQQYNGKFKGYVDYPCDEPDDIKERNCNQIQVSRVSHKSNHSNQSNTSQRSALLERAEQYLVQSRLSQNIKSLSKNKFKTLSNSRTSNRVYVEDQENPPPYHYKRQTSHRKEMSRSKSTNAMTTEKSRTKILQQIADKLKKVGKQPNFYEDEENRSNISNSKMNSRVRSQQNEQNQKKSRVQKIKQIKQQMSKNRGGKLQHLLKDIKKSNKQAYKVVYTIKKANVTASPFQKSLQMRDKIHDEARKPASNIIHGTNLFQTPPHYAQQMNHPIVHPNSSDLRMLAQQLHKVRIQLKQVKNKNDELLQMSQLRSQSQANLYRNQDSGSQSSRITRQIQALQIDALSNGSGYRLKNSPVDQPVLSNPPSFAKIPHQQISYYNASNISSNQKYHIVQQPDIIQACFACGCTCKSQRNINR